MATTTKDRAETPDGAAPSPSEVDPKAAGSADVSTSSDVSADSSGATTDEPSEPDTSRRKASSSSSRKAKRTRKTGGRDRSPSSSNRRSLKKPIEELLLQLGGVVAIFDPFDGAVICGRADKLARALDDAAKDNDQLRRALELLLASGGWGGLLIAVGGVALPIAAHHGLLPDPVKGAAIAMAPKEARDLEDVGGIGDLLGMLGSIDNLDPSAFADAATAADAGSKPPTGPTVVPTPSKG